MLADYDMTAFRDTIVATLPRGQKLVDIAMAMVSRPAVLLLDEPTSGVSVAEKFTMLDTIMAAVKEPRRCCSLSMTSKSSSAMPLGCWLSTTARSSDADPQRR